MVAVWMVTYNHGEFIEKAIESVMMQKTTFQYKLFIGEDFSTDNTREICKKLKEEHPDKIELFLHDKNIGSNANGIFMYEQCFKSEAKYIALLEGDDYWTDPYKLQKQVDFLNVNPEFTICWTKYCTLSQKNDTFIFGEPEDWINSIPLNENFYIDLNNIFTPYCTYTLTCLFRNESFDLDFFKNRKYTKDNTLYAICLTKGKGVLLDFYGAVYRLHEGGIYSSASPFKQKHFSYLNIKEIIKSLPECNNNNFRIIRNYLLLDSLTYLPKKDVFSSLNLFKDSFLYFGLKKTMIIFLKKIKSATFTKKIFS